VTALATRPRVSRYVEHVMGMPVSLALRGRHLDDTQARDAWAEVMADLREVDRVFSTYREDSFVSRLDRGEVTLAECPPEVADVLELGRLARMQSGGAFDVRRRSADGALTLDPNGVVKGWAVQRASAWLHALADTDFCVSAGGDLVCHTDDPAGEPWRIGIEDPADTQRLVGSVAVNRGAVATSGTAHRGAHIIDARTGAVPTRVASVTVLADTLTWADIDATAAYALGTQAAAWLAGRTGRRSIVVWRDGTVEEVSGPAQKAPMPFGVPSPVGPSYPGFAVQR
jgi:FAD:protein FMN transferase